MPRKRKEPPMAAGVRSPIEVLDQFAPDGR